MVIVREMPFTEKYASVLDNIRLEESFVPSFIRKHLDEKAAANLQWYWQYGFEQIPGIASDKDRYEIAYGNWIRMWQTNFRYIRERLGSKGIELLKRANVEALKRENDSPSLILLKLLRVFVPGVVFSMVAKKLVYQLQWLNPFSVSEMNSKRLVLDIPQCKIKDFPDSEELCNVGCQSIYPLWLAEQFRVEMKANRRGSSCSLIFSLLR